MCVEHCEICGLDVHVDVFCWWKKITVFLRLRVLNMFDVDFLSSFEVPKLGL